MQLPWQRIPAEFVKSGILALLIASGGVGLAGETPPTPSAGKSITVAAPFLKKVEAFRRKVVFFTKDVDLPCLKVPEPGERVHRAFSSDSVVMSKDGELLFCTSRKIVRLEQVEGVGEVQKDVVALPDLTLVGDGKDTAGLHFEQLLAASTTKNILYLSLSDQPIDLSAAGPSNEYSNFVGMLDRATKRLRLIKTRDEMDIAIDPDGAIFEARGDSVARISFGGRVDKEWKVPDSCLCCWLAPDRKSLLLFSRINREFQYSRLDLATGIVTVLPITGIGCALAWGADGAIFYIDDDDRGNGVIDTSLFRFQIGQKEPVRLFKVSCKRVRELDTSPGVAPKLSADHTWLAWPLAVERPETGTILLDLRNNEYRVLDSRWQGIPCDL